MTAIFCKLFYRQSIDIPFPPESSELANYFSTKYAGSCIKWRESSISEDKLTLTYRTTWINLESLEQIKEIETQSGPLADFEQSTAQYCEKHKILSVSFIE